MKRFISVAFFFVTVCGHEADTAPPLRQIISTGNCTSLLNLKQKFSVDVNASTAVVPSDQIETLREQLNRRITELSCSYTGTRRRRQVYQCPLSSPGDGWCDALCNNPEHNWDGGDCCQHTCRSYAPYPCGSGGYRCLAHSVTEVPSWFKYGVKMCFNYDSTGDAGQCGMPGSSKHLCADFNSMTSQYRDATDERPGGCLMSWGLESSQPTPGWFREASICFREHPDTHFPLQCGNGGKVETCAPLGTYTQQYLDNTDGRKGGCYLSWKFSVPNNAEPWTQNVQLCFKWEPETVNAQCGSASDTLLCGITGMWTPFYRDDTDHRYGGCKMQWGFKMA